MKKILILIGALVGAACSEKPPATPEQRWEGYCRSVGYAARTISFDRINGISLAEAKEHANKIKDKTTLTLISQQIEKIYAAPIDELRADKDKTQEKYQQQAFEQCLATPHDPNHMPDYKPF
ncbi:hypothetical protein [Acinetobacter larvae]|uniref:Lipoprotein n=1 Tax=Acinetobacter larvae TaxID=1789224 RepID=A0A1B2M026_9GAMM|nr:hypothetical protein [Acinetobacter larvae]AOA58535.1 hypothetical protein BFG52_09355 [Acinetobacter larvae]